MKAYYQRGMTLGSTLIVSIVLLFFVFSGFKLFPKYMEYWNVKSSFNSVAKEFHGNDLVEPAAINKGIMRNFEVNSMSNLKRYVKIGRNKQGGQTATIAYEREVKYIGNLYFLMKFEHSEYFGKGADKLRARPKPESNPQPK